MITRTLAALCLAGLLPLFAGCAHSATPVHSVPVVHTITVGADKNGQTVKAVVGGRLILSLASNPTTGFDWKITAIDPTILTQAGESTYKQDPSAPGKVGVGGIRSWIFDVKAAGSAPLTLEYRRAWMPVSEPAGKTFTVTR